MNTKKILVFLLIVTSAVLFTAHAFAAGVKIGVFANIGLNEDDLIRWSEKVAEAEGKTVPFKNPNTLIIYDTLTSMLLDLQAGRIDRIALNKTTGKYIVAWNDNLQLNDNHHIPVLGYSIAMRNGNEETMSLINKAITDMKLDGTLDNLIKRWLTDSDPHETIAVQLPVFDDADTIKIAVTGALPPLDVIRPDGMPSGFNTALIAELSKRLHKNFSLVSVTASARGEALLSQKVDAVFWTRGTYDSEGKPLPYLLDAIEGVIVSEPYFIDSRVSVSLKK